MNVRLSDRLCLTPRLLDAEGRATRRVEGVLETVAPVSGTRESHFVDAVHYDGRACRYRVRGDTDGTLRWLIDDEASTYRSFAGLVIDRLCRLPREWRPRLHRFAEAPPSRALTRRLHRIRSPYTLSVLDTCVTPDGRLWLRAALRDDAASGWKARHRPRDPGVCGWLPLTDAALTASGPAAGIARGMSSAGPSNRLSA